jgi:hypothetical protein
MLCLSRIILLVAVASSAVDAHAQSVAECRRVEDSVKRLSCYDSIIDPPQSAAKQDVTASFTGYGTSSTRPFTVNGPWTMHWSVDGGSMSIVLLSASGKIVDYYGTGDSAATGSAHLMKGGTFTLETITNGRWKIKVESAP